MRGRLTALEPPPVVIVMRLRAPKQAAVAEKGLAVAPMQRIFENVSRALSVSIVDLHEKEARHTPDSFRTRGPGSIGAENRHKPSSLLDSPRTDALPGRMETNDEFHERIRREQRLAARLRLATERLEEAQQERIWAVVEAHQSGLSIRQIAAATGLSSSRVHQLLGSEESREVPRWLSQRRDQEAAPTQATPTSRPALRARWRRFAGAASGWNAWSAGSRSW